jgi:hypothetical protein
LNGKAELLNFVYQNAQMGVNTIQQLIGIAEDEEFKNHLKAQLEEYEAILGQVKMALVESGHDEKGLGALEKIRTYLMINMQTMTDKSASHIAEMLMIGSNMGIINAIKNLKKYKDVDPKSRELMEKLLNIEEDNVQQLKKFL